jgi:RNA polymerase sigma-70 factor, ECF subfamily
MDDLRQEEGGSLCERPEPAQQVGSPMTTLTLSAGLNDAGLKNTPALIEQSKISIDQPKDEPIDKPIDQSFEEMDDHSLLEAIRTGDEAAFREIVRRYSNPIINFVYRILGDYDRATDMAQETFFRIYQSAERYQATYSFSTYIYKIARNLAISELRQRKRRKTIPFPTFSSDKEGEEIEVELPDQKQRLADDVMIEEERLRAASRAIASLPEKYREALVLCDIEERSYEEISEILDLNIGTVKSRINRARNLLKEKLQEYQ